MATKKPARKTSGPPKSRAARRDDGMVSIELLVPVDLRERIDETAAVAGVSRSEWLRKVINERLDL